MVNRESIAALLKNTVEHLRAGNLEQAEADLDTLNFGRLLQEPIPDPSKGASQRFIDPRGDFGTNRVNATGSYIRMCKAAMDRGDQKAALDAAERALRRWQE